MRKNQVVSASLLLLTLLSLLAFPGQAGTITDTTTTREYAENFESFNSGQAPTDSWYTITSTGSGSNQVFSPASSTFGKAWRVTDTATGYATQMARTGTMGLCRAGEVFSHDFVLGASILTATIEQHVSVGAVTGTPQPANSIGYQIIGTSGAETLQTYVRGSTGAATLGPSHASAVPAGTIIHAQISQVNCSGVASAVFTFSGGFTASETVTNTVPASGIVGGLLNFGVSSVGTTQSNTFVDIDNYDWTGAMLPAPTVTSVAPAMGTTAGGTSVTITGTGFKTGATATIGGAALASPSVTNGNNLAGTAPAGTAGAANVIVTNPDGQVSATCTGCYTYATPTAPTPTISSLSPSSGPTAGGTVVTIAGANYVAGATVTFGGTSAGVTFTDAQHLQATTPNHVAATVNVIVTNPDGQSATATGGFTYTGASGGGGSSTFTDPLANSGRFADVVVSGTTALIAHIVGSGNALIATISQNSGATWTDYSVAGASGYSGAAVRLRAFITDQNRMVIMAWDGLVHTSSGQSGNHIFTTTNGGTSWSEIPVSFTSPNFNSCAGVQDELMPMGGSGSTFVWRTDYTCFTGSCNPVFTHNTISVTTDFFATSSVLYDLTVCAGALPATNCGMDVSIIAVTVDLYWCRGSNTLIRSRTVLGGSQTAMTIQDNVNPVTFPGFLIHADRTAQDTVAFAAQSNTGTTYLGALIQSGNAWQFTQAPGGVNQGGTSAASALAVAHFSSRGRAGAFTTGTANTANPWRYVSTSDMNTIASENLASGPHTIGNDPSLFSVCDQRWLAYQDTNTLKLSMTIDGDPNSCPAAGQTLLPSAGPVTVSGLLGMQVDRTGTTLVLRQAKDSSSTYIKTMGADGLTVGATATSSCTNAGGVAALQDAVAYLDCGSGHGSTPSCPTGETCGPGIVDCGAASAPACTQTMQIRNIALDKPNWPQLCDNFCDPFLTFTNPNGYEIRDVYLWPFTYNIVKDNSDQSGNSFIIIATAYSTVSGKVGIVAEGQRNNEGDRNSFQESQVTPSLTTPVTQVCSGHNKITGQDFQAAGGNNGPVKVYTMGVTPKYAFTGSLDTPQTSLTNVINLPANFNSASSVACAQDLVLVDSLAPGVGGQIGVFDWVNHTQLWARRSPTTTVRAVALSADGNWGIIQNGTLFDVIQSRTGRVLAQLGGGPTISGGNTIVQIDIDGLGQHAWVGTSTGTITEWTIYTATTVIPRAIPPDGGASSPTDPSHPCTGTCDLSQNTPGSGTVGPGGNGPGQGGGIGGTPAMPGVDIHALAAASGLSDSAFGGLVGILLFVAIAGGFALLGAGMGSKGPVIMGSIGAVGGLGLDLFFGLMPLWLPVALVIIALAFIIFMRR